MKDKLTFEQALLRLEELTETIEKPDATLDASLTAFDEAIGLLRFCRKTLDEAEAKFITLTEKEDKESSDL